MRHSWEETKQWIRVEGIAPTIQATDSWKTHRNHKAEIKVSLRSIFSQGLWSHNLCLWWSFVYIVGLIIKTVTHLTSQANLTVKYPPCKRAFHRSLPFRFLTMFLNLAIVTSLVTLSLSATYNTVDNLPTVQWDFIIVGGTFPVSVV